jgi:hypothetical protein
VLQLADVTRPRVPREQGEGGVADPRDRLPRLARAVVEERVHERGQVRASRAERRHAKHEAGDPVVEVAPEAAVAHPLLEIGVRGGHDAHVHRHRRPPDGLDLAALQRPQQLGLQRGRHVADLVEKEGSSFRRLELPRTRHDPGGDAAADAEHLRLEKVRGDGGAVHGHERPPPPPG